jgi:DNA invertase Pin-like site-specific DNA recombinase
VVKLDRLGRSTRDVLNLVHELEQKGAGLRVLEPEFCTSTDTGRIPVTVLGMVAEMERKFVLERQQGGIEAAKKKGIYKGRKPSVPVETVREMYAIGKGPAEIAAALGVSPHERVAGVERVTPRPGAGPAVRRRVIVSARNHNC